LNTQTVEEKTRIISIRIKLHYLYYSLAWSSYKSCKMEFDKLIWLLSGVKMD